MMIYKGIQQSASGAEDLCGTVVTGDFEMGESRVRFRAAVGSLAYHSVSLENDNNTIRSFGFFATHRIVKEAEFVFGWGIPYPKQE
ncbi:hypothetical protein KIN20_002468 [Parelaphostrongylus tenuis]|uniref:Uncharacterized protein n=1 Tax=Parelaphostrongylus tenuis TaxID=148309 RepID=A0AAD5MGU8_PARTN|nr:hypothetical protein KIN20_002468 [Parelaphostrongylus tenuis]